MRYLSITGFYPDDAQDNSLQFELDITGSELNEKVAQLIESKPLSELEPGELLLSAHQVAALETLLNVNFPKGLEFFMGTCTDY
ncbi:pyocin S6 family toxin immunity protein [Pseudomonas sp. Irchel s3a12]|uniref:pyocin S6 family toxin immunity protein n=1 Tax=Pseudomonas sp. Irchel s3a12 TaxID=2009047 RepID=UPI000BA2F427|nr:pyocin S6 family toxin immunity protein [Pseudomonas sp. Irchel s3a12]